MVSKKVRNMLFTSYKPRITKPKEGCWINYTHASCKNHGYQIRYYPIPLTNLELKTLDFGLHWAICLPFLNKLWF